MLKITPAALGWLTASACLAIAPASMAQKAPPAAAAPAATAPAQPAPAASQAPAATAPATIAPRMGHAHVPEGTEVQVTLADRLSSETSHEGDEFGIVLDKPIRLADGTVIPEGYLGRGEVIAAHKKGMLGKGGELSVRLDYLRVGDKKLKLRANKSGEGGNTTTTTVALTLLVTPLFLMHHGHEIVFAKGTPITAYVDDDSDLSLPLPAVPKAD